MTHSNGFLALVNEAKSRIQEVSIPDARAAVADNQGIVLMDVREDAEWAAGHAQEAVHLGKGVLERDIEARFPDKTTPIIMYCGGGFRSALTADVAQRMGYTNIQSLQGGYKGMVAAGWPMTR